MIEEISDIAEDMADQIGIHGGHEDGEPWPCRCCFVSQLVQRIKDAKEVDAKLKGAHS